MVAGQMGIEAHGLNLIRASTSSSSIIAAKFAPRTVFSFDKPCKPGDGVRRSSDSAANARLAGGSARLWQQPQQRQQLVKSR
jgi:hypothetical protein